MVAVVSTCKTVPETGQKMDIAAKKRVQDISHGVVNAADELGIKVLVLKYLG